MSSATPSFTSCFADAGPLRDVVERVLARLQAEDATRPHVVVTVHPDNGRPISASGPYPDRDSAGAARDAIDAEVNAGDPQPVIVVAVPLYAPSESAGGLAATPEEPEEDVTDRATFIRVVRRDLQRRSGLQWSVKGGRGTAYGWVTISAPPSRLDPHGSMSPGDQADLAKLLDLHNVSHQGASVPPQSDYRREYADRAAGRTPRILGVPQWD